MHFILFIKQGILVAYRISHGFNIELYVMKLKHKPHHTSLEM